MIAGFKHPEKPGIPAFCTVVSFNHSSLGRCQSASQNAEENASLNVQDVDVVKLVDSGGVPFLGNKDSSCFPPASWYCLFLSHHCHQLPQDIAHPVLLYKACRGRHLSLGRMQFLLDVQLQLAFRPSYVVP